MLEREALDSRAATALAASVCDQDYPDKSQSHAVR